MPKIDFDSQPLVKEVGKVEDLPSKAFISMCMAWPNSNLVLTLREVADLRGITPRAVMEQLNQFKQEGLMMRRDIKPLPRRRKGPHREVLYTPKGKKAWAYCVGNSYRQFYYVDHRPHLYLGPVSHCISKSSNKFLPDKPTWWKQMGNNYYDGSIGIFPGISPVPSKVIKSSPVLTILDFKNVEPYGNTE